VGHARALSPRIIVVTRVAAPKALVLIEDGLIPAGMTTPAYDWRLSTPTRRLAVRTMHGATLLEVTVPSADTRVRVWTNHPTAPTEITIGVERVSSGIAR
jgi:hypothetical protein